MSSGKKLTAIEKRAENRAALARFELEHLKQHLPLVFPGETDRFIVVGVQVKKTL